MYDIAIIGAGVTGCSLARELSRYRLKILLLEKADDVSCGASKANSGIIHGGYAAKHGSLKARLCRRGNRRFSELDRELNFGYAEMGNLVLAFSEDEEKTLQAEAENGRLNGVDDLEFWDRERILAEEPAVSPKVRLGLYCPSAGVTSPYEYTIALAENAVKNGVDLRLKTEVLELEGGKQNFTLRTSGGDFSSRIVINAAGAYADRVERMLGLKTFQIIPRQGQYLVFRRGYGSLVHHVLFQTPTKAGKGILVTPTYWGNLMIGPNAEEKASPESLETDVETLWKIVDTARKTAPDIDASKIIRSFSGIRPTPNTGDFIIGDTAVAGFFQAAGIESPGLTSSPAVARYLIEILKKKSGLAFVDNPDFDPCRPAITRPGPLRKMQEIKPLFDKSLDNPEALICRCEQVSGATIRDAATRGIPLLSTDAVKRRTRAGMGACQGRFCGPRVKKILSEIYEIPEEDVPGRGETSGLLPDRVSPEEIRKLLK